MPSVYRSVFCVLFLVSFSLAGQRVYITPSGAGLANGSSWANARPGHQLQMAINGLSNGGEIWVAAGTYLPTATYDNSTVTRRRAFRLASNVRLFGGFAGSETDTAQRSDFGDGELNETILSGDIGVVNDSSDNSFHVIWSAFGTVNARVDGFSIQGGVANGSSSDDRSGGGVYLRENNTELWSCVIKNNFALNNGGGGLVWSNNRMHGCVIKENRSNGRGGGIYFVHFNLSNYQEPVAENCLFFANFSGSEGGGAHLRGGGQVTHSRFIANYAIRGGGAYVHNQGTIANSVVANNRANISGGGLHLNHGQVLNSTVVHNQSGGSNGGGIYRSGSGLARNTVIWGNNLNNNQVRYLGSGVAFEHCAIQAGFSIPAAGQGLGIISLASQNSGSSTSSLYPQFINPATTKGHNPANPNLLLAADWNISCQSALIDAGNSSYLSASVRRDFLGNKRFQDGNGNGDSLVDIGAFEYQPSLLRSVVICPGDTIALGAQLITAPGLFIDTIAGLGSCDSLVELQVFSLPADSGLVQASICEGDSFIFRGQSYRTAGKYYLTAPNATACDSIIELDLSVLPVDSVYLPDTVVFQGQNPQFYGRAIDSSGIYYYNSLGSSACDSVIIQKIDYFTVDTVLNAAFCAQSSYVFQARTLNRPGNYYFFLADSSVLSLVLRELPVDTVDLGRVFISAGASFSFFGTSLNSPGTYYHTLNAASSCDSVLKIQLFFRKYVTQNGRGVQDGNSWSSAYSGAQLQSAIDNLATNGGGQVWVAKGLYKPGNLRSDNFFIRSGIELIGGFAGNESDSAQRNFFGLNQANQTVLSGDVGTLGDSTDNCYQVLVQNTAGYALVDGFVIRDAFNPGISAEGGGLVLRPGGEVRKSVLYRNYSDYKGGGLFATGAKIEYCRFVDNRARSYGGAAQVRSSQVRHCYFQNNRSRTGGGALQLELDHLFIDSCTFDGNVVETYGWGGAIAMDGSMDSAAVRGCVFNNNVAVLGGAAHNLNSSSAFVYENCLFTNNQAPDFIAPATNTLYEGTGGALLITEGKAVNCEFRDNSASRGGALWVGDEALVDSCRFENNTASGRGGAIYGRGNAAVRNSRIMGGNAAQGGGAYLEGTASLYNMAIEQAQAPQGGGVYAEQNTRISHSRIAFCSGNLGAGVLIRGGAMVEHCDIYNNSASRGGGLAAQNGSGPLINSRIFNNSASQDGGGVFLDMSNNPGGLLVNSHIYNNSASRDGGGVFFSFGGEIINANVSRNFAGRNGGGVFMNFRAKIRNSLIWGNNSQIGQASFPGTSISVDTSAIQGGYSGHGAGQSIIDLAGANNGQDSLNYPRFSRPTQFQGQAAQAADSASLWMADWNLLCASAAIDAGNNLSLPDTISRDQAGNDRFMAGQSSLPLVDLGPLEASFVYQRRESLCQGDTFIFNQQAITTAGQYLFQTTSAGGCDSNLVLNIDFLPTDTFQLAASACQSQGFVFGPDTLFQPGVYYQSFTSPNFCDSVVALDLQIVSSYSSSQQASICIGDTFYFRGRALASSGIYRDTLPASNTCDSIISLDLKVEQPDTLRLNLVACGSLTYDGITYTSSGTHLFQYSRAAACDSFVELQLAIVQSFQDTIRISACQSYQYNNQLYTTSGFYSHLFNSSQNCDSTVVLDLLINQADSSSFSISACEVYDFNGRLLRQSGSYVDSLQTQGGCDSLVSLNLSILPASDSSWAQTACGSYNFNGRILFQSGLYYDTLRAANTCDSVISVTLSILPEWATSISDTACGPYDFNGRILNQSGRYTDTLTAINGCDSVLSLDLNIRSLNLALVTNDPQIIAQAAGMRYQWWDCDGDSLLSGQNSQSFTATRNGNYAVIIDDGFCSDTSECINIASVGLESHRFSDLRVFPNPSDGRLNIRGTDLYGANLFLRDMQGRLLYQRLNIGEAQCEVKLEHLAAGSYVLLVQKGDKQEYFTILRR